MHYLRVLLALSSTITSITALPSAKGASLAAPAPSLDEFLTEVEVETLRSRHNIPQPRHVVKPRDGILYPRANVSSTAPNATVEMCTLPQFKGDCANSTWPVNTCINLNGYAGVVQSFQPVKGYECLLTQGRCDVTKPFISIGSDESDVAGDDLTGLAWIKESKSYMCFTEIAALRRFVKLRLRTTAKAGNTAAVARDIVKTPKPKRELVKMWEFVKEVAENLQREKAKVQEA